MARESAKAFWTQQVAEQEAWMQARGGSEAGYVDYYGSRDDPDHYGDGGEAIYAADKAALTWLRQRAGMK